MEKRVHLFRILAFVLVLTFSFFLINVKAEEGFEGGFGINVEVVNDNSDIDANSNTQNQDDTEIPSDNNEDDEKDRDDKEIENNNEVLNPISSNNEKNKLPIRSNNKEIMLNQLEERKTNKNFLEISLLVNTFLLVVLNIMVLKFKEVKKK